MGRAPCCEKEGLKKGPWTPEEDKILVDYIHSNGHGSWRSLPKLAGLLRCGKSCRLRWTNYLRPDIKRGPFTADEQKSIIQLHGIVGNKWSTIAAQLPGRTDNEVKNYWNTHLKKRLLKMGIDPDTYTPATAGVAAASPSSPGSSSSQASAAATRHMAQWESARLEAEARLAKESLLYSTTTTATSTPDAVVGEQEHDVPAKPETDFFLRIWNSEVGRAFRSKERAVVLDSSSSSPATSSTKCKNGKEEEVVECKNCGCDGGSSEEVVDEASSESYQLYLDFADDIGMGSLFNGQFGSFSLFGGDMNMNMNMNITDVSSLDDAFKWPEVEKTRV